jgi:HAD superfamily hydrolase (TIGR01509 family)
MIKALIFDFDGLMIETEICDYQAWLEIYREYGLDYPVQEWQELIGTYENVPVPLDRLDRLKGPIDREAIDTRRRERSTELALQQELLPGVMDYLVEGQRMGLKMAIASSSPRVWLEHFLEPRNLTAYVQVVVTGDTVSQVKPSPELFNSALQKLGVKPDEAVVFEDSFKGLQAARAARIRCVIIPSNLTRGMDFKEADLLLKSLDSLPLETLLEQFNNPSTSRTPA